MRTSNSQNTGYGLPFQSLPVAEQPAPQPLPAFGELGGPAFEMVDAKGNITRAGTVIRDPQSGMLEPDYSDIGYDVQGVPTPPTNTAPGGQPGTDPVGLAVWQGEQEMGQLAVHDTQLANIKAPIQHELDTSYKQYLIDVDAARSAGGNVRQAIDRITASYQKKWVAIEAKIEPQVAAITQAKTAAEQKLRLNQALRMKEIQTYAEMAKKGLIDDATAKSMQYKALGYNVSVESLRPKKQQNPFDTIQDNLKLIKQYDTQLRNGYRYNQKTGELRVVKPQYMWQNPYAKMPNERKDTAPAAPGDYDRFMQIQATRQKLSSINHQLSSKRVGGRVVDIAGAAGPLADGIRREKPRTEGQQPQPAELKQRGTREAYELGVRLGYWQ